MLKTLTRPITDYQSLRAGKRAASTNTYDPHAHVITKLPRVEPWDPHANQNHKEIQLLIETETEETIEAIAIQVEKVRRGSPLFTQGLLCFCLGTELLGGVGIAHELGAQGPNALLLGVLLGTSIFFLLMELHR